MSDDHNTDSPIQAVRDLLWAINSPELVDLQQNVRHAIANIATDDVDVGNLLTFLKPAGGHRVGRYFERLIQFYLEQICQYDVWAHGLQIHRDGRTVGELDFVFKDQLGVVHHWETAVKFYLHRTEQHSSGSHLVGPNPADQFESKLHRMLNHQLPLGSSVFPNITERHAFVKGRIFYHIDTKTEDVGTLPCALAQNHLRGNWCYESEINRLNERNAATDFRVRILTKPHWLSDDQAESAGANSETMTSVATRIGRHFQQSESPVLLSIMEPDDSHLQEINRVFVVANSWPGV